LPSTFWSTSWSCWFHIRTFNGSIIVCQRDSKTWNKSRIHKCIYNFYSLKYYKHFTKWYNVSLVHIKSHLQSKRSVYLSIFWKVF
jgi:hypothetical protein